MHVRTRLAAVALALGTAAVPALSASTTAASHAATVPAMTANFVHSPAGFAPTEGVTTFTRTINGQTVAGVVTVANVDPTFPQRYSLARPNGVIYSTITVPPGNVGEFRLPPTTAPLPSLDTAGEVWTLTGSGLVTPTAKVIVL